MMSRNAQYYLQQLVSKLKEGQFINKDYNELDQELDMSFSLLTATEYAQFDGIKRAFDAVRRGFYVLTLADGTVVFIKAEDIQAFIPASIIEFQKSMHSRTTFFEFGKLRVSPNSLTNGNVIICDIEDFYGIQLYKFGRIERELDGTIAEYFNKII